MMKMAKPGEKDCDDVHDDWYERRATPRIRLLIISMVGAVLGTASMVLFFVINSQIQSHELADRETMVSRREFEATVARIERRLEILDNNVTAQLEAMSEKLDRNYSEIRGDHK